MNQKPSSKSPLEKLFFDDIEKDTPDRIKNNNPVDISNPNAFQFILKKEHLLKNNDDTKNPEAGEIRSPEGLALTDWFKNYEKEAKVSTAGIRGLQNPLYPWDTRYPLNTVGVMLATLGKILVAHDIYGNDIDKIKKLVSSEVRYNSQMYVDVIARLQAAYGLKTYKTDENTILPIWMVSFLVFVLDLYGAEYVTSSHAISKKIATKDINFQGGQYIPEESIMFVNKIHEIFKEVQEKGQYVINFSAENDPLVDKDFITSIALGIDLYVEYLKTSVATDINIDLIKNTSRKIIIECMGGSMYEPLSNIFKRFDILEKFDFFDKVHDPFFNGIGKFEQNGKFNDLGCDSTIIDFHTSSMPVIASMNYSEKLKDYPLGTAILMTDPDGDRLVTAQIESKDRRDFLNEVGINFVELDADRVLAVYMPNQSFLMNMDFQMKALKNAGLWDQYNWFIIKTTPSAMSWDEWAMANNIPVVNTPVGFKEISTIMQKVEGKISVSESNIIVKDVFGKSVSLGQKPRMLFGGEESGGEIFGPCELIKSKSGRTAISMREKSAGEAIVITAAMYADLEKNNLYLSDYLNSIFNENKIFGKYDIRIDKKYYNENESDITKLKAEKESGIKIRTLNDMYFLSIALQLRIGKITIEQVREILAECFTDLNFDDLKEIHFVGDGTYLLFETKYVEVRPSGTDAINKAYAAGNNKEECIKYAESFASHSGERNTKHKEYIEEDFYNSVKDLAMKYLIGYQAEDLPTIKYEV